MNHLELRVPNLLFCELPFSACGQILSVDLIFVKLLARCDEHSFLEHNMYVRFEDCILVYQSH